MVQDEGNQHACAFLLQCDIIPIETANLSFIHWDFFCWRLEKQGDVSL